MSGNLWKPKISLVEFSPEARELFDRLINETRFLDAFEHILKAREYDREWDQHRPQWKKMSWQAKRKLNKQIDDLSVPEGYTCVPKFHFADAEYETAKFIFDSALYDLRYSRTQYQGGAEV